MRVLRRLGASLSVAVCALVLPLSQAQAADCVRYKELNHCGIGSAYVSLTGKGVQVVNGSTSGGDGVAIHTGLATNWTAAAFIETDDKASRTLLSSVSEGFATSTATIAQQDESISYASTFTGAGDGTTYSMLVYRQGVLQASVGGIQSGMTAVVTRPDLSYRWAPYCRPIGQTYMQCMNVCRRYANCNYCSRPCQNSFTTTPIGSCEWRFDVAYPNLQLLDGRVVQGDVIVMSEELHGPSNYPYLGFDQIHIQTTARTTTLSNESVVSASPK